MVSRTTLKHGSNYVHSIASSICIASSIIIYIYVMNIIKLVYHNMSKRKREVK